MNFEKSTRCPLQSGQRKARLLRVKGSQWHLVHTVCVCWPAAHNNAIHIARFVREGMPLVGSLFYCRIRSIYI